MIAYMKTIFFRFLVSQFMYSHHITKSAYDFVPILDMNIKWDDKSLSDYFELNDDELDFMSEKIRAF